jgi:hypothetical protein
MAVKRPSLLQLGGEEAFAAYEAEFDRLYRSGPITDVLGNRVQFERNPVDRNRNACWHACTQEQEGSLRGQRIWVQARAERITWILPTLTDPGTEVRPNFQRPDTIAYAAIIEAEPAQGWPQGYFFVVTAPHEPGQVRFVTAFPTTHDYWVRWRRGGRRPYPPPDPPKPGRKRRK